MISFSPHKGSMWHYSHFKNEKTQAQRKEVSYLRLHISLYDRARFEIEAHTLIFTTFLIYRGKKLNPWAQYIQSSPVYLLSVNTHCLLYPRNTELFLFSEHCAPSKLHRLCTCSFLCLNHPPVPRKVFRERGGPPVRHVISSQRQLITWCYLTALFPSLHHISFSSLPSRGCWQRCLVLQLTHTGPPIRGQLEARRRALAPDLTFDNITAILTVCHGACQGTWKDSDWLTQRDRERAWDLK